ncbi:sugar nucleotide-binding protein [Shimia ponticola]|uniref:sugar nucleotide-binding protein n=1 Tax=Shimia ponticola TaxID=2582893 RepID=UPI0011BE3BDE|nr:sugar nucleotide-binding protein [Shimia ponticola]
MQQTVLILGATGRFGRHASNAFAQAGWDVRTFNRATDNLWDAAWGADVIVNAWHMAPQDWADQVPKLHAQVREVALASGATVIIPGNIYGYGDTMPERLSADTPQLPSTGYGEVRKDMEAAYRRDGVRTIILRAGDFLDDEPSGNWFDKVMTARLSKGIFVYPGPTDVSHAWAFLPDMARAAVALAEKRHDLQTFEDVPYPGLTLTGQQMREVLERVTGEPLRTRRFPWLPIRLTAPFLHLSRYLSAMKYLWDRPHHLDGARLAELAPEHRDSSAASALAAAAKPQIHPDQGMARQTATG